MSDTDDGFDEEAVREELREKYEDDDRGETERMSELLLQGATMTNQHCDRCGNPIFRYEGQSFCPNCQQTAEQGQGAGQGQAAGQQGASQQQPTAQQPADGQQPEPEPSADARADDQQVREAGEASRQASQQPAETAPQAGNATGAGSGRESPSRNQPRQSGQSGGGPSGEGAAALDSSIAALARRAAGADDPRRAREFLEAAREAAEALDALRRNA